ncbi:hypothetical protein AB0N73_07225 [Microbacterium sp. NPDC089189]|uniref:hypothetical protein n=1 Tax=Microbacterium sp. NPDC089189 TaxID=3154972 RepID=UPI00342E67FC
MLNATASRHAEPFPLDGPDRLADRRGTQGRTPAAERFAVRMVRPGIVSATLPSHVATVVELRAAAAVLGPVVDAVLIREPPGGHGLALTHRAAVLRAEGADVIVALSGRDRNRVAVEGELAALADIDIAAVLVPGREPTLDLDATQIAALARRAGHTVAVPEAYRAADDGADLVLGGPGGSGGSSVIERAARRSPSPRPTLAVVTVDVALEGPEVSRLAEIEAAMRTPGVVGIHLEIREVDRGGPPRIAESIARLAARIRRVEP